MLDLEQVPFLAKEEIAREALGLLDEVEAGWGRKFHPPIPADEIIEFHLGLDFRIDDLEEILGVEDVLGALWPGEKLVVIDERVDNPGRFMFTCGHEIGHWCLHRQLARGHGSAGSAQPTDFGVPAIVCRKKEAGRLGEWQANLFSACLLMPEDMVRKAFRDVNDNKHLVVTNIKPSQPGVGWTRPECVRSLADKVKEAGGFTNVSRQAMMVRLFDLGLLTSRGSLLKRRDWMWQTIFSS